MRLGFFAVSFARRAPTPTGVLRLSRAGTQRVAPAKAPGRALVQTPRIRTMV